MPRIIFIYCWIHDWERVSCFLDLSAGCLLLYTLIHRPMWCRFRFQFEPFCLREGLKKISFSDSVSHFQEISSFVDQKSLLILCFWVKLPKNISSFPIKFGTITPAINMKSHQSFVGSVRLLDFWKSSQI